VDARNSVGVTLTMPSDQEIVITRVFDAPRRLIAEQDGKTRMTFRQSPFQSIEERDGHQGGWTSSFDRLEEYVAHVKGSPQ
jgi:uncharacterized protein YndB with AHSA1/START domain